VLSWQRVRPEVLAQPSEHGRMHEQSLRGPEARRQLALHAHSGPASAALGDWVPAQLPGHMHGHCIWSLEYRHPVEGAELVDVHCEPRNEKPRSKAGLVDWRVVRATLARNGHVHGSSSINGPSLKPHKIPFRVIE